MIRSAALQIIFRSTQSRIEVIKASKLFLDKYSEPILAIFVFPYATQYILGVFFLSDILWCYVPDATSLLMMMVFLI